MNNLILINDVKKIGTEIVNNESIVLSLSRCKYFLDEESGSESKIVYEASELVPSSNELEIIGTRNLSQYITNSSNILFIEYVKRIDTVFFDEGKAVGFPSDNVIMIRNKIGEGSIILIKSISSSGLNCIEVESQSSVEDIWSRNNFFKIDTDSEDYQLSLSVEEDAMNFTASRKDPSGNVRIEQSYLNGLVLWKNGEVIFQVSKDGIVYTNQIDAGAPAGTITNKIPIYDNYGYPRGFIPVYN